jgi:hypothetical protein
MYPPATYEVVMMAVIVVVNIMGVVRLFPSVVYGAVFVEVVDLGFDASMVPWPVNGITTNICVRCFI